MIWNAAHGHGVIDPQVIVAALAAAAFLYARFKVTPVADPRDGNGQPLKAVPAPVTIGTGGGGVGGEYALRPGKTLIPPAGYTPAGSTPEPTAPPPGRAGASLPVPPAAPE